MNKYYLFLLTLILPIFSNAQYLRASLQEDGRIQVMPATDVPASAFPKNANISQLDGFPMVFEANQNFKNFRNVTLADLDGDGAAEIITGINDQLYAIGKDGIIWKRGLTGHATFPPSVADIDGDGDLEIALATWQVAPSGGHLYVVDHQGEDLVGWPLDFGANILVNAPVLSDIDGDGQREIIIGERQSPLGRVHILNQGGSSWNANWPVTLDATPAVTPSIGDVDADGEKEIVVFSTKSEYVLQQDGTTESGWPIVLQGQKHSYQSPILVDLDMDKTLEIVGATHGDRPEFFVRDYLGSFLPTWPKPTFNNTWTFSTPTVLQEADKTTILMSHPQGTDEGDMLYAWSETGVLQTAFPIFKAGGLEGIITLADLDGDDNAEMLFGSNLFDQTTGSSFIHAYRMDGSGELAAFPIRPRGWTFMNGATLGDVDGDEKLDIVVLSYTQNFGAAIDSVYINAYATNIPYNPARIWWSTYKGSNSREGALVTELPSATAVWERTMDVSLFPNPAIHHTALSFNLLTPKKVSVNLVNRFGQTLRTYQGIKTQKQQIELNIEDLPMGLYFVILEVEGKTVHTERLLILQD